MNTLQQFKMTLYTVVFNGKLRKLAVAAMIAFLSIGFTYSQAPTGYYTSAQGLTGNALQLALHNIIKGHTAISYAAIWNAYSYTDDKQPGNICWDMYSDYPQGTPAYTYTLLTDQCSTTPGYEGVCYNREHSFPKSWFGGEIDPMYTDLFHVIPSDSYVNSRRNNYPYGTVSSPTWVSTNGSKLGPCSFAGYTGTVFEPNDAYKGDLARDILYMAIRYADVIATWENLDPYGDAVLDGTQYPAFEAWAIQLLLRWHLNDPVDQKEIDRNNEIYLRYQGNRNPFIDNPEYASLIWTSYLPVTASVSTSDVSGIGLSSAISGGTITNNTAVNILSKGVCWGTNINPTITDSHTNEGPGNSSYTSTLSGLSSGTTYYVRAYITTSTGTTYGYCKQFVTNCSSYSLPYLETFSLLTLPSCWYQIDNIGNGQLWKFGIISNQSPNPALNGYYAYLNSAAYGSGNTQNADLVSPQFNFTGFTNVTLSFNHFFRYYTGSSGKVYYSLNNGSTWVLLAQFTSLTPTNPATFSQTIPQLAGQDQVRFKWNYTGTFGFYWAIDDVSLTGQSSNTLTVTPSSQSVNPLAGMANYSVSTNTNWTASSDATWCLPTPSGTGSGSLTTTYQQNSSINQRTANITITVSGTSPVVVSLLQDGAAPFVNAVPASQTLAETAGSTSYSITSNTSWTASSNQNWCSVTSSGIGNGTLQATVLQNTGIGRTAIITVQSPGIAPISLELIQAAPEPTADPSEFAAHNIILTWTDATGNVLPTGYLIRMSPLGFDAIVSPSDGVAVMDSQLDKNVAFGIQQAVFSNLQPSTTYYFRVFSYSGSGNQIQYNTQDGVSQIQLTTGP